MDFLADYDETKYLQETGEHLGIEDQRNVADLLVDQVELTDVLISKTDLLDNATLKRRLGEPRHDNGTIDERPGDRRAE